MTHVAYAKGRIKKNLTRDFIGTLNSCQTSYSPSLAEPKQHHAVHHRITANVVDNVEQMFFFRYYGHICEASIAFIFCCSAREIENIAHHTAVKETGNI